MVKNPSGNAGDASDVGSNPKSGRSPGGGRDNPLQYSCLENSMNRGPGGLQSIQSQRDRTERPSMHAKTVVVKDTGSRACVGSIPTLNINSWVIPGKKGLNYSKPHPSRL